MNHKTQRIYEFGPCRLDIADRLLWRNGVVVPLQPKVFDLLLVLIERHGRLVEKEELMKAVWPDTFVEEANIASIISILRKTLGDNGQQFIETAPKRGYRFVAEVQEVGSNGLSQTAHSPITVEEKKESDEVANARQKRAPWRKAAIAAGVALLCVAAWVYFGPDRKAERAAPASIKSIAVLPFKPLNHSQDDEYLGIGLADAVITRLSGAGKIIVRSTGSVSKYTASIQDPLVAGREQQVDTVLDASLWRSGEKVRVTARLLRVRDGMPLWTWQCEETCTDVFTVQTLISEQVAGALMPQLTGAERARLTKHYTEDREANQLYLLGRYFWSKRIEEAVKKSIVYYNQAIEKDPNYALAFAGLADSYIILGVYSDLAPKDIFPKANAAAMKALKVDDDLAEAHASLAEINADYYWDWMTAEREFKRAIELDPNYATAHQWYSEYLSPMGRFDEAITEMQRAQELEPLSLITSTAMGLVFYRARQNNRAIEQWRKTLEIDPNFWVTHFYLGLAYVQERRYEAAISEFHKAKTLSGDDSNVIALLGYAYGVAGNRSEAQKILDKLILAPKQQYTSPFSIAEIYIGLREKDRAFEWLEKAYEDRTWLLRILKVEPIFDPVRSDPRFTDLLRRIGLAP
ncbi:MAG TPA: winged helix-turn-helix domain-containing protein [Bryobacteraceae bacterium]|jgi:DNA-binding winged helix-turn-helix (wHTH) protein/TolB-like protein/Flp pilus assembly protein TadD